MSTPMVEIDDGIADLVGSETTMSDGETENRDANAPAGFSRRPEAYRPTEHFLVRYSPNHGSERETRLNPQITSEVIETCITEGTLREGHSGRWRLEADVDGYRWRLVVAIHADSSNAVLTALVPGVHDDGDHEGYRGVGR